jgi:hypothetical protein
VHAAAVGVGIGEMPAHKVRQDLDELEALVSWLDRWRMRQLDALLAEEIRRAPAAGALEPTVTLRH